MDPDHVTEQINEAAETITHLVLRPEGATLPELMHATGWKRASIRAFVSTVMRKEMKLKIPMYHGRYLVVPHRHKNAPKADAPGLVVPVTTNPFFDVLRMLWTRIARLWRT
jgi:hypothetical protein